MDALKILLGLALVAAASAQGSDRILFKIAIGHDWGANEYFNDKGYIDGFNLQLITEVCAAANIDCRTVWDKYTNCWDSKKGEYSLGGKGLMGNYYNACTGWAQTIPRIHVFDFSEPFLYDIPAYFFSKTTEEAIIDLAGKKVGFLDGWWMDEKCLARASGLQNNVLPKDKVILYATPEELTKALGSGDIDYAFATEDIMATFTEYKKISTPAVPCAIGGNGMMTRKGSPFLKYWNMGFRKLRASGRFGQLCREQEVLHKNAGKLHCVVS